MVRITIPLQKKQNKSRLSKSWKIRDVFQFFEGSKISKYFISMFRPNIEIRSIIWETFEIPKKIRTSRNFGGRIKFMASCFHILLKKQICKAIQKLLRILNRIFQFAPKNTEGLCVLIKFHEVSKKCENFISGEKGRVLSTQPCLL